MFNPGITAFYNTYPNLSASTSSRRQLVMTSHSFPAHIKKTNTLVSSLFNSLVLSVYLFFVLALTMHANFMKSYKNRTYIKKIYSNLSVSINIDFCGVFLRHVSVVLFCCAFFSVINSIWRRFFCSLSSSFFLSSIKPWVWLSCSYMCMEDSF